MGIILNRVMRICHLASCIPLAILVVMTSADVIARYAFAASIPDTIEISGLMLGILISLALAPSVGEQVRFDLVADMMPWRMKCLADIFTTSLSTIIFALMGWQAVKRVAHSKAVGEYVGAMEIVVWPAKAVFAFACFLAAAALLALVVANVRRLFQRPTIITRGE